jgi:glycosyltransferase involved in cell wall biosynthesis
VLWIPYGVDLADGNDGRGAEIAIGFWGRLERADGADLLPALAGELQRLRPGVRISWVIAGSGPSESRLRQAFAGREANFVGDREPAADLLIVLSEGSRGDWTALEALRRGTPVVAFHTDSREEIVAEGCGVLVPGGRDGEFRIAAAIAELLQDLRGFDQMQTAARRQAAQNYSTAAEAAQIRVFLQRFLGPVQGKIQSGGS